MALVNIASFVYKRSPGIRQIMVHPAVNSLQFSSRDESAAVDKMKHALKIKFPLARSIEVCDISGGCGDMYEVNIESVEFKGLTVVKQHRMVNDALKDEIKNMHGIRIQTQIPPQSMK